MPAFNANAATNSPLTAIYPGDAPYALWSAETPLTSAKSQQVALGKPWLGNPQQISIALKFAADPGAFTIDIQTADTDAEANYVDESGYTKTVVDNGTNFTCRWELNVRANFVRLFQTLQNANSVTQTATISVS